MLQYSLSNEGEKGKEDIKFLSRGKKEITKIWKKSQVISFQSPCSICSLSIRLPDRTMNQLKTTYKLLVVTETYRQLFLKLINSLSTFLHHKTFGQMKQTVDINQ